MKRRGMLARGAAILAGGIGPSLLASCAQGSGAGNSPPVGTPQPANLIAIVNRPDLAEEWTASSAAVTREHPNIKVEFNSIAGTWGQYFEKIATMVAGGTPPDFARVAVEGVHLMAHRGMALPLDALIKRDARDKVIAAYLQDVDPVGHKSMAFGPKQVALAHNLNIPVLHYNTKLFAQAGISRPADTWTIEDFERIARQIARPDEGIWGVTTPNGLWGGACPFVFLNGADFLSDDWSKSTANDPKMVEAVERWQGYSARLRIAPPGGDSAGTAWNNGMLAMRLAGAGAPATYARDGMKEYDVLPMPRWKTQNHVLGSGGMAILKDSRQQEATWTTLKFTVRDDMIVKFALGTVPARRSLAYNLPIPAGGPPANFKLYADVQKLGLRTVPAPPEFNEFEAMVIKHLKPVLDNAVTPRAALDALHRELSELLSRRSPSAA
jgi:multiple sugar transport system substrate-binding protein